MVTRITSNLIQPTSFKVGEALGADTNMPEGKIKGMDKIEKSQIKMKAEARMMQLQIQDYQTTTRTQKET